MAIHIGLGFSLLYQHEQFHTCHFYSRTIPSSPSMVFSLSVKKGTVGATILMSPGAIPAEA